jgi:hypothetical protein
MVSISLLIAHPQDSLQFNASNIDYAVSLSKVSAPSTLNSTHSYSRFQAASAAANSHFDGIVAQISKFAAANSLQLSSLNLPPPPSISCFNPKQ